MLKAPIFGVHLHAFYGDAEMVVGLQPLRVIQSEAPAWVEALVLEWARRHELEFRPSGIAVRRA